MTQTDAQLVIIILLLGAMIVILWRYNRRPPVTRVDFLPPPVDDGLTSRERAIVDLAIEGLTNAEIGRKLDISVNTVEHHLKNVYRKLGIHSRRQLERALRDLDSE